MNPFDMMKNLQGFQSQIGAMQEKLKDITVIGSSGGDMVKVAMNGQLEVLDVSISEICVDPRDVRMLEDLVKAAYADAQARAKAKIQEEAGQMAGGLNLPPGFPDNLV